MAQRFTDPAVADPEQDCCAVKTTITAARTKTAWCLNFDVNAFDFIGSEGCEVYLA